MSYRTQIEKLENTLKLCNTVIDHSQFEENKDLSMMAQAEIVKENILREIDEFYGNEYATSFNGETIRTIKGYLLRALWEWNTMHAKVSQISQTDFENLMYSFDMALFTLPTDEALNWYENQK